MSWKTAPNHPFRPVFSELQFVLRSDHGARQFVIRPGYQIALIVLAGLLIVLAMAAAVIITLDAHNLSQQGVKIADLIQENSLIRIKHNSSLACESPLAEPPGEQETIPACDATLADTVSKLRTQVEHLEDHQAKITDHLKQSASTLVEYLSATGLDTERLLQGGGESENDMSGSGGPLIPLDELPFDLSDEGYRNVDDTREALNITRRTTRLLEIASNLPLVEPVGEGYRFTSRFGARRDPFTSRPAWHEGLDLAAPEGTPVLAAGPGQVKFVGKLPGYGNTLDIQHPYGIVSRYAHLKAILVQTGQELRTRQQIAQVGSTGRSTGPHLHYEVRLNDKKRNPFNFFLAGQHVFQIAKQLIN